MTLARDVAKNLLNTATSFQVMPDDSHPLIGQRLVRRLSGARSNARCACARCGDYRQVISFTVIGVANSHAAPRGQWATGDNGETLLIQDYRVEPCVCNVEAALQMTVHQENLRANSGMLTNELNRTLDDLAIQGAGSIAMIAAAKDMIGSQPFGMLTIHGGPGNGKTLLMQAMVNHFIGVGQTAKYRKLSALLDDLRDGYSDGKFEATARFHEYAMCKFLGLDEFDKAHLTGYAEKKVDDLIDERYRYGQEHGDAQRFTVIAMNDDRLPFESLPSHILSRLRYGINTAGGFRVIHNTDPDCRQDGL